MVLISKTGLLEGLKHPVQRHNQTAQIEFPNVARPAPYILKPFAGIYNPFPYGCSILCNHPADYEAKDVVRRAKDSWSTEGKALLLPEELSYEDGEDAVPEELFRRYTDTDSRPLTPAPTLASARTRGSGRRCVTPDPLGPTRERTLLVLDLRRSHSQDTLSWQGISYTQPKSPCASTISITQGRRKASPRKKQPTTPEKVSVANKLQVPTIRKTPSSPEPSILLTDTTVGSGDEEIPKRRGKRKKRAKKAGREGSQEFQGLAEPGETQVSAIGGDSRSTSARPSLTLTPSPCIPEETAPAPAQELLSAPASRRPSSFLQPALLRTLQRDLDHEVVDCEFDPKRRRALEEALKTRVCEKVAEGVLRVKKELVFPPPQTDLWLSLPRVFSRQSARFSLPFDSRDLNSLKPLQYLQQYVTVTSSRKLLYNTVFNRHREDDGVDRRIIGKNVVVALGEVMGSPLTEDQMQYYQGLVGWDDGERLDFRQWCGVAAACERLLGPRYIAKTPPRSQDPCHEVERADFGSLPRRLRGLDPDPRLLAILNAIREL